jgi:type I restriction enzyme, S subunit
VNGLPKGWLSFKLGQVADKIQYGYTSTSSLEAAGPRYLRITDIQDNRVEWSAVPRVAASQDVIDHYRLVPGDIVFARSGATVGKSFLVPDQAEEAVFASYLIRVQCDAKSIYPPFAAKYFQCPAYWKQIVDGSTGTGQPNFNATKLNQIDVPLPPLLVEQRRIVAKLDSLTGRTARAQEQLGRIPKLIQKYREAILAAAFSGELTGGWRVARALSDARPVNLGSVASEFSYGSATKSSPTGEVPVLRMGNIQDGSLNWGDLVFTSNKDEIAKYALRAGDVLFNRTNSPALVGKTALYRGERPAIYAGYLIRIRCSPALMPAFLTYCLNSPAGRDYCWRAKTDGVSQSNINAKKLAAFQLPMPTVEEQQEIVQRIEAAFAWLDRVAAEHANASRLLPKLDQAILAKAFRGELCLPIDA